MFRVKKKSKVPLKKIEKLSHPRKHQENLSHTVSTDQLFGIIKKCDRLKTRLLTDKKLCRFEKDSTKCYDYLFELSNFNFQKYENDWIYFRSLIKKELFIRYRKSWTLSIFLHEIEDFLEVVGCHAVDLRLTGKLLSDDWICAEWDAWGLVLACVDGFYVAVFAIDMQEELNIRIEVVVIQLKLSLCCVFERLFQFLQLLRTGKRKEEGLELIDVVHFFFQLSSLWFPNILKEQIDEEESLLTDLGFKTHIFQGSDIVPLA
jgi:hypothetical protein